MEPENPQPEITKRSRSFKTVSDWAGLLRNFASIIASFISLVTLVILIKQNERTYRPDLIFKPDHNLFRVTYREPLASCEDITLVGTEDSLRHFAQLTGSNIGLGAAKDLKVSWQYQPDQMDDTIAIGPLIIATQAKYNSDIKQLLFQNCFREEPLEQSAEFCLPVNVEKDPVRFKLPENYLQALFNILTRICHYPSISFEHRRAALLDAIGQFQNLQFTATYKDINNKRFSKNYRVHVLPAFIDIPKKEMLVTWSLVETDGRNVPARKHTLTIISDTGSYFVASLEL